MTKLEYLVYKGIGIHHNPNDERLNEEVDEDFIELVEAVIKMYRDLEVNPN